MSLTLLKNVASNALGVIFPPICIHCRQCTENPEQFLCQGCVQQLQLLSPHERCPRCFHVRFESGTCSSCAALRGIARSAAVFEHYGPAVTLVHALKFQGFFKIAKDMAAWMLLQFETLGWPLPDALVPVPQSLTSRFIRGYNQSLLIAEELGAWLGVPIKDVLRKTSAGPSQTGLDREQRKQLAPEDFSLKKTALPANQRLLLIDDVMTTGATLHACASALAPAFPKAIYALTFTRGE